MMKKINENRFSTISTENKEFLEAILQDGRVLNGAIDKFRNVYMHSLTTDQDIDDSDYDYSKLFIWIKHNLTNPFEIIAAIKKKTLNFHGAILFDEFECTVKLPRWIIERQHSYYRPGSDDSINEQNWK